KIEDAEFDNLGRITKAQQIKNVNIQKLGNWENKFDDENDQIFLSTEWNSDFNLGGREIHPADDDTEKWNLNTLFELSLKSPAFLESDEIFTNAY
ncbi:1351_t:CDS:2, partial [Diversispora eburnea]